MAMPGIDTQREIELIHQGHGQRVGDSRYRINACVYIHKPDGGTYPESGEGIVSLTNSQFRALRLLIKHDGHTVEFDRASERDPRMTADDIAFALELFHIRKGT